MHRIVIILLSMMLIAPPVYAQAIEPTPRPTSTPTVVTVDPGSGFNVTIPEGSPWWAGIALTILGAGGFLLRGYSRRLDQKQQAALETQKNDFQFKLERLKFEATERSADASQIGALASSISDMATSVNSAITTLAAERLRASEERGAMRETLENQTKGIRERNELLRDVGEKVDKVGEKVTPIDNKLQQVASTLEELKRDVVTKQVLTDTIDPLVKKIDAALKVIHDLQQPDPAPEPVAETPAENVAPAEHGTVEPAETKTE